MSDKKQKTSKEDLALMKSLDIDNVYTLPKITRVIVSSGVGRQRDDKSFIEAVKKDLARITGQQPHERMAKKAVAGFNVREGNLVGFRVTLRGKRMEDFVDRFVNITLPRIRDFRGVKLSSFDGKGNLSFGLSEHLPFPEIDSEKTDVVFGVQVTFVTSADNDEHGKALLKNHGFPLVEMDSELELT
jgi:large subunit ribosomal protein L5